MDSTELDFGMFLDDTTKKDSSCEPSKIEFPLCYDSETCMFNQNIPFFSVISELDLFITNDGCIHHVEVDTAKCEELRYGKCGYYKFNTLEDLKAVLDVYDEPPF